MKKRVLFTLACLFLWTGMAMAQVSRITGVVVSAEDNEPIVGASVLVKGTTLGTITDMNGRYSINNIPVNAKSLVISFVGMKTQELAIKGGEQRVVMQSDTELIDEVVVVAYGTQKKSSFTGAASTVGAKSIEKRAITNVTAALEGNASGVQVTAATGQPGESSSIRIRGFGSVNAAQADCFIFAIVYMIELIHTFAKRHDKYVAIFRTSSCPADVYLGETVDLFGHRQPTTIGMDSAIGRWFHHTIRAGGTDKYPSQSFRTDSGIYVIRKSGFLCRDRHGQQQEDQS